MATWCATQPDATARWVNANGFDGALGQCLAVPGPDGAPVMGLVGFGTRDKRARGRFHLASAQGSLPAATYRVASGLPADEAAQEALGWLLAGYRFDAYRATSGAGRDAPMLLAPEGVDARAWRCWPTPR